MKDFKKCFKFVYDFYINKSKKIYNLNSEEYKWLVNYRKDHYFEVLLIDKLCQFIAFYYKLVKNGYLR